MERQYELRIADDVIERAKANGLYPLCVKDINSATFDDKCVPDVVGVCIGYVNVETDKLESNIKGDDDASKLRGYIDNGLVVTKVFSQRSGKELKKVPHYFMTYNVVGSSKYEQTYTEDACGYGMPIDGHYKCRYEVLLGSDEYTRRMVFEEESANISMYDWLTSLMDKIEDGINERDEDIMQYFKKDEEGVCFTMFDEVGIETTVEFERCEFESMIVGVRQLSCEFVYDKDKENVADK